MLRTGARNLIVRRCGGSHGNFGFHSHVELGGEVEMMIEQIPDHGYLPDRHHEEVNLQILADNFHAAEIQADNLRNALVLGSPLCPEYLDFGCLLCPCFLKEKQDDINGLRGGGTYLF